MIKTEEERFEVQDLRECRDIGAFAEEKEEEKEGLWSKAFCPKQSCLFDEFTDAPS